MGWPVPDRDADPWFAGFESMIKAMDSSSFASREDNELIIVGDATYTLDAIANLLSWTGTQEFVSPFSGYAGQLTAASLTVYEGDTVYVNFSRSPTVEYPLVSASVSVVPNHDDSFSLCTRRGGALYFKTGARVIDGQPINILGFAEDEYTVLDIADRQTHNDVTRLSVGAIAFNPADHAKDGMTLGVSFGATVASGNDGVLGHVTLRNFTDGVDILTLDATSSSITDLEQVVVLGSGSGEIGNVERIYEILLHLDAPPSPGDSVELYSAEIRVENLLP